MRFFLSNFKLMQKSDSSILISTWDYDPFGMLMMGRNWSVGSQYKYGFNGQERDVEISGNGNLNTAEFWEYDCRLGRRWNLDPKLSTIVIRKVVINMNRLVKFY